MKYDNLLNEKIYHYYYPKAGPLKSITEVPESDVDNVLKSISETTPIHHSRLTLFKDYLPHRKETELLMKKQFIERGGKPTRDFPFYFILGNSPDYSIGNPECEALVVDSSKIDTDILSFTFCDSMIAYPFQPFFDESGYNFNYLPKDFHGQTYHFNELGAVLNKHGHPNDKHNSDYPFPGFIEVQVWGDINLESDCMGRD